METKLCVRLSQGERQRLDDLAERRGVTTSDLVRDFIRQQKQAVKLEDLERQVLAVLDSLKRTQRQNITLTIALYEMARLLIDDAEKFNGFILSVKSKAEEKTISKEKKNENIGAS